MEPVACPQAITDVKNKITCSDGKTIILTDIWETSKNPDVLTLFSKDGASAFGVTLDIIGKSKDGYTIKLTTKDDVKSQVNAKICGPESWDPPNPKPEPKIQEEIDDEAIPAGVE
jgi:hypothetical protein